jgi:hypothetical protein
MGKAFCMRWSCPECAIRLKNVLKRRLKKVSITAIFRATDRDQTPKLIARVRRGHRELIYLRVLGESDYVLVKDASSEALAALQAQGLELTKLNPSSEEINAVVDETPYASVRRRQRRLIASRGFWPTVAVNSKHSQDSSAPGSGSANASQECLSTNSDEPEADIVVVRGDYGEVIQKLKDRGFELVDVGLGESHRLLGQRPVAPEELGEVIEVISLKKKPPPKAKVKGKETPRRPNQQQLINPPSQQSGSKDEDVS